MGLAMLLLLPLYLHSYSRGYLTLATPVFCDIYDKTYNINADIVKQFEEAYLKSKTQGNNTCGPIWLTSTLSSY